MYDSTVFLRILQSRGIIISEPRSQNGGNSKIFKFTLDGERLILKKYLGNAERIKISKEREISAYRFLQQNNLIAIPKLYEEIYITDGICLEHVQGEEPLFDERTLNEISRSMSKLKYIFEKNSNFREATDACFTTDDVLMQMKQRKLSLNLSLPLAADLLEATIRKLERNKTLTFPDTTFTYSLSDLGPHNMISKGNKFTFIDFEFFGKDSAVKMIIDFLLHPKNMFPTQLRRKFLNNAMAQFEVDLDLVLKSTPFFAAKWAAIVARRMTQLENKTQANDLTIKFKRYIAYANLENESELLAKLMLSR